MNQIYILDLRSSGVGGAVVPGRIVQFRSGPGSLGSEDDLRLESEVTFLVHGYNVNREDGRATLARLAKLLHEAGVKGALVAVLWPGDSKMLNFASYPFEARDANDSATEIARFVGRVIKKSVTLSFVSHSLGARVVMKTVQLLQGRNPVSQICLMAAAIDDFSLAEPKNYRNAVMTAGRVVVLASENDKVLRDAYPIGDRLQSFLYADELFGQALGLRGPKSTATHGIPGQVFHVQIPPGNTPRDSVDHRDYLPAHDPAVQKEGAAARFAGQVLQNEAAPVYRLS